MNEHEVLRRCEEIVRSAHLTPRVITIDSFYEYAELVRDVVKDWPAKKRDKFPWLKDWALSFRRMYDDFDAIVSADPMLLYQPANRAARQFHRSKAFVRYFRAGNRTSKTQSGYAEHYYVSTNQHKWRHFPGGAHSSFIIGVNFSKYCPAVFEKKFLEGEEGNPLSPMFPPGGKWFYRYDERRHEIQVACSRCAESGKARTCSHEKSTIRLFSDQEGWEVLQGAAYILGHFDEHVGEDFFNEAIQRTQTAGPSACLVVTGTPLHGHEAWEHQRLTTLFEDGPPRNRIDPDNTDSPPFVSLHEIDQFEAGLVPHERIRMAMAVMDEFEIESRVYGRPAPLAKNPVFNRHALSALRKRARDPRRGDLRLEDDVPLSEVIENSKFGYAEGPDGPLRVWEEPALGAQYIISVDTAKGLAGGDASCASVLRVDTTGGSLKLRMVAQYHGYINPLSYAEEVFKLAVWYSSALVVIELTGGYGEAVMLRMRQDFCYWNLFRDEASHSQAEHRLDARFGVETNMRTKPYMVAALQQFLNDEAIDIPCTATISEMVAFEQERTQSGMTTRYRGVNGAHDDRVMSLVIGASVALSSQVLDFSVVVPKGKKDTAKEYQGEWRKIHEELSDGDQDPFDYH